MIEFDVSRHVFAAEGCSAHQSATAWATWVACAPAERSARVMTVSFSSRGSRLPVWWP